MNFISKVDSKYERRIVLALKKIISIHTILKWRTTFDECDVNDALAHISDSDGYDVNDVHLIEIKTVNPSNLKSTYDEYPAHRGFKPEGWLKILPENKWAEKIWQVYDRDLNSILEQSNKGGLSPVIIINGLLGDGFGRVQVAYALGETVRAAYFKSTPL